MLPHSPQLSTSVTEVSQPVRASSSQSPNRSSHSIAHLELTQEGVYADPDAAPPEGVGAGLVGSSAVAIWTLGAVGERELMPALYRTTPHDAGAWSAAVAVLVAIAVVSAWLPARSASRRDPLTVLNTE